MNHFLNAVTRALSETFDFPEPVLELGSYQVKGQEEIAELRGFFPGKEYQGVDLRPGPGVDCVADATALPHLDGSVGTVLALSTFEHVPRFWRGFDEVRRVLRPDGALFVSVPFHMAIHNYPSDYWRFTPEALDLLLEDYPSKILGWHGATKRPENVWALAFREGRPAITSAQYERYRALLARYASQPTKWQRTVRYRIGSWFCGRRPFAPYLDRARWGSECRNRPAPAPAAPAPAALAS